jgi:Imm-5 like putative immunity protein
MKLFKSTNQDNMTQNETKWGEDTSHSLTPCKNPRLCTRDVLHAYKNLNLALLLNPIHGNICSPKVWEAEGEVVVEDYGKVGCFSLKTTKEKRLPTWYKDENRRRKVQVQFAILCAEEVLSYFESRNPEDDRPRKAIEAAKTYLKTGSAADARAAYAAYAAAYAAADAYAADAAAYAARAAADAAAYAYAADAAARAAYAADAAARAAYAAYAADAAADAYAADAAAYAARAAADAADKIDFSKLADAAVKLMEKR